MEGYAQQFLLVTIVPAALPRHTYAVGVMPSACLFMGALCVRWLLIGHLLGDKAPRRCGRGVARG